MKLELEKIYKNYCNNDLKTQEEDKFIEMMKSFVEFRLDVSGGSEGGCMVSMTTVNNFLDEIFLFDNMMHDWSGAYRGDYCWENYGYLEKIVNESELKENIKTEILKGYKKENGMDK